MKSQSRTGFPSGHTDNISFDKLLSDTQKAKGLHCDLSKELSCQHWDRNTVTYISVVQ